MKKAIFAMVMAAGAMVFAEEDSYVDPNPYARYAPATRSTEQDPLAVVWSRKHDAEIAARTTDEVLAASVADAASAEALLKQVRGAYETDPLTMIQIAAVTQWVMRPDPWYCLFWNGPHAAGRAVWKAALEKTMAESGDGYVKTFCRQQLALCR